MKNNKEYLNNNRTGFFTSSKKKYHVDESTFLTWKNELQKELPCFWESMNKN